MERWTSSDFVISLLSDLTWIPEAHLEFMGGGVNQGLGRLISFTFSTPFDQNHAGVRVKIELATLTYLIIKLNNRF